MADTPAPTPAAASSLSISDPPRQFGDWAIDGPGYGQWFKEVVGVSRQQAETIKKLGGDTGDINPADLPDPATSSVAKAQQTANDAYLAALAAGTAADDAGDAAAAVAARLGMVGTVTISDLANTGDLTFATAQPDTGYFVLPGQAAVGGTPDPGSTTIASIAKTVNKCTLTLVAPPNTGNSVSFTVMILRAAT